MKVIRRGTMSAALYDVVSAVTLWIMDHYLFGNILACFY